MPTLMKNTSPRIFDAMSKTLALTEELISLHSVTPADGGCQLKMAERLAPLGFTCETIA